MTRLKDFRYTFYACYAGYFVQSIINNFLPLLFLTFRESFGLSHGKISLLIVIKFSFLLTLFQQPLLTDSATGNV